MPAQSPSRRTPSGGISETNRSSSIGVAADRDARDYEDFFDNVAVPLHWVGPDGCILRVNQAELDMLGYAREDLIGRHIASVHVDQHVIMEMLAALSRGDKVHERSAKMRCKDGSVRDVLISSNALFEDGHFVHTRCVTIDITERLRAEQMLQEREKAIREMADALPAAIYTTDSQGRVTYFNSACIKFSGRTPELGTDQWCVTWKLYHPDGTPMPHDECPMAIALQEGRSVRGAEAIAERPDGTRIWFEPYPTPLFDDQGKIIGGINMLVDISRRKRSEVDLRHSEQRYQQLLEMLPIAVYTCEAPSGRVTYFNENAVKLWGRTPKIGDDGEQFCGSYRIFLPDGTPVPLERCAMALALNEGKSYRNVDVRIQRSDGTLVPVIANIDPIRDSDGTVVAAVNALVDTSAAAQAQADIARLAAIVESSEDAILSVNLDGTITSWNAGAVRLYGYTRDQAIGSSVMMLIPADRVNEERDMLDRIRIGETIDHYETQRQRKDGSVFDVSLTVLPVFDATGVILGASKIARDITDRKRAEAARNEYEARLERALTDRTLELTEAHEVRRRSEAMAVLGALSAGIAHDLANLLLPMRTRIRLLSSMSQLPPTMGEHLTALDQSVDYISQLGKRVKQYMSDAAKEAPTKGQGIDEVIDLATWCEQIRPFFDSIVPSDLKSSITIRSEVPHGLPALRLNKTGLTQTVYNLVQNAVKAMCGSRIGTSIVICAWHGHSNVFISIEDDGPGMSPEILARCQEPRFTTHRETGGSGLGLSLVKAFVDQCGGEVRVYSPPPNCNINSEDNDRANRSTIRGTAVTMRFPIHDSHSNSTGT